MSDDENLHDNKRARIDNQSVLLNQAKEKASKVKPNILPYEEISAAFGGKLSINTPKTHPDEWTAREPVEFYDSCIIGQPAFKKTYIKYVHKELQPCTGLRRVMIEVSDVPGFYYPELTNYGYVSNKNRKDGGKYRLYVPENGHPSCAKKLPTNRFGHHTISSKKNKNGKYAAKTQMQCSICIVATNELDQKKAELSLFSIGRSVCAGCQMMIGEKKSHAHPCHGENCEKHAHYPQFKDNSGVKNYYCAKCYEKTHKEHPPSRKIGKCNCDLKRRFNKCAVCCIIENRPVDATTCTVLKDGSPCNTRINTKQHALSKTTFPNEHPMCPGCFQFAINAKKERIYRENIWRDGLTSEIIKQFGDAAFPFDKEITFGNKNANECMTGSFNGSDSMTRRADAIVCFHNAAFVFELDQYGHSETSYKCDHNSRWNQLIFDSLRQLRGPMYDVYIIRVNPDGYCLTGARISSSEDRGVSVSVSTTIHALMKLMDHAKKRAHENNEHGKCFISHYFYPSDSKQLENEKNLCVARPNEFEVLH